ncbi:MULTISPECIES: hypothetical protein [Streptococcus]|uniref:hypothetical protein n=1 Tax=Streptococcus TaxID=1301 RepID=UPI00352DEE26
MDSKTCFVVMGFGTKKIPNTNIEVDLNFVYNELIKPTIISKKLTSVYGQEQFRADEVYTTQSITKTFIEGIFKADIVIADITTLNQNAIYELGLRHAMKPKSTIILCDNHTAQIKFFDIQDLPQIRYDSDKLNEYSEFKRIQELLSSYIDNAKNSDDHFIDSPVFHSNLYRVISNSLTSSQSNTTTSNSQQSWSELTKVANALKDSQQYVEAEIIYKQILDSGFVEDEIVAGYLLSSYKKDETNIDNLKDSQQKIIPYLDIKTTTFHKILGIYGAIYLRIFYITKNKNDLLSAIHFYRLGMNYEDNNIYCARNYCANLLKIADVETDIEVIKEHYYTAKYTAKYILGSLSTLVRKSSEYDDIWLKSNQEELLFISGLISDLKIDITGLTDRQSKTIREGREILKKDLSKIRLLIND